MRSFRFCFLPATLLLASVMPGISIAQSGGSSSSSAGASLSPLQETMRDHPWNWGAFFSSGFSAGDKPSSSYLSVGVRAGKVLTEPHGRGLLRGQFEYSGEIMPWWQGRTDTFTRFNLYATDDPNIAAISGPYKTGGAYNGISITPILLRWDFATGTRRILPLIQGGGGLIWTNHKFPPVGPFPAPGHQGTSVWNFTPQFGVGVQYFLRPKRSITFNANAIHISNASLGDANPGVNATVQFQIGYSWWK
ncbi:MAG TPA: acyloxyacyl hydrolase [Acidobacteriaceae bacterium]